SAPPNTYPSHEFGFSRNDAVTESPSSQLTLPCYSIGWRDGSSAELSQTVGQGGGPPLQFVILPGLSLAGVPACIGVNHTSQVDFIYNLQQDPTRPWLYVNGNPAMGFTGPTYATLKLTDIVDRLGQPAASLPIEMDFFQGVTQHVYPLQATRGVDGTISLPTVNLGLLTPQTFAVRLKVPNAGPSYGRLSARIVPGSF